MAGSTLYYLDPTSPFSKDTWLEGCVEQIEDTPGMFFNMLDKIEPTRMEGRNCFFKVEIGDSLGQAQVTSQGGDLPLAEDAEYAEGKLTMARLAHTAELTMDEWELLQSETAAAVNVVAQKLHKATQKMTRELARQTIMDGTGIIARCTTTTASTTVNIQSSASNQYDRDRLNWLVARRILVDIVDATTGAIVASRRKVNSVNAAGTSFVISGAAVTTSSSHVVTWAGAVGAFSSGTYASGEVVGLNQLMKKSRTWLGINSATAGNDYWDAVYQQGSTPGTPENLTINRFQKLYIAMANKANDGMQPGPNNGHILFSGYGPAAHAIAQLAGQIRYTNPGTSPGPIDFGFQEIEGLGIRWFTDVHYPHNVIDCLKISGEDGIAYVRPTNPMQGYLDFVTTGSGDMWHLKQGVGSQQYATAMQAFLTGQFGLVCRKPSENGRMDDINEPA